MNRFHVAFSIAILAASASFAAISNITGFGTLAIPTGEFADDASSGANAGLATTGFGVGGEYNYPIDGENFIWSSSAFWIFNPTDEDELKKGFGVTSASGMNYWNVPLLTGLKLQKALSPAFTGYVTGQAGFNYKTATDGEIANGGPSTKVKVSGSGAFAFSIGAGMILKQEILNHRIHISGRYMSLGKPTVKLKTNAGSGSFKGETNLIAILAGLDF